MSPRFRSTTASDSGPGSPAGLDLPRGSRGSRVNAELMTVCTRAVHAERLAGALADRATAGTSSDSRSIDAVRSDAPLPRRSLVDLDGADGGEQRRLAGGEAAAMDAHRHARTASRARRRTCSPSPSCCTARKSVGQRRWLSLRTGSGRCVWGCMCNTYDRSSSSPHTPVGPSV